MQSIPSSVVRMAATRGALALAVAAAALPVVLLPAQAQAATVAVAVRSGSTATAFTSGSSRAFRYVTPGTVHPGDLQVVAFSVTPENASLSGPSGWSLLTRGAVRSGQGDAYAAQLQVYLHVRSSHDPATATWTLGGPSGGFVRLPVSSMALSGVDTSALGTLSMARTSNAVGVDEPSVAGRAGGMLVSFVTTKTAYGTGAATVRTPRLSTVSSVADTSWLRLTTGVQHLTGTGATGARAVRFSRPARAVAVLLSLSARPAEPVRTVVPVTAPARPAGVVARRSGLAWASGLVVQGSEQGGVSQLTALDRTAAWRGRAADITDVWVNRASWDDLAHPYLGAYQGFPGRLSVAVAMVPQSEAGNGHRFEDCAQGRDDAAIREFAHQLVAAPYSGGNRGDSLVRLGWEMNIRANGNDAQTPGSDYAGWIGCWRRWHDQVKAVAPQVSFVFNPNHDTHVDAVASGNIESIYPGDAYVDEIGPDRYNWWDTVSNKAAWDRDYGLTQGSVVAGIQSPKGMGAWLAYAQHHHKLLAVPEWATTSDTTDAGNAFWLGEMSAFFRAHAPQVAWEVYYDIGCGSLLYPATTCSGNAVAAAQYAGRF